MAGMKTGFISGKSLFYPLESLPALFGSVGTNSRKKFFQQLVKLDGADGEGLSTDKLIEFVRIGLMWETPAITTEDATQLANQFIIENDYEALENTIVDAFADSGLSNKELVCKQRAMLKELQDIQAQQMENMIEQKRNGLKPRDPPEKVVDMGEASPKPPTKLKTAKKTSK
jgi:hypothetical protein